MKRFLPLLFITISYSLLPVCAQSMKPCGTSVLRRIHPRGEVPLQTRADAPAQKVYAGEKRGLVILVSFPNQEFKDENTHDLWDAILNEQGYSLHSAPGSVSDYFYDQSYGQFRLHFDVVGPVQVSQPFEYYGKNKVWSPGDEFDQKDDEMIAEACMAVSDSVSFADYDWDGDGQVDALYVLFAGYGESDYFRKATDVIYPHSGQLSVDWAKNYPEGLTLQGMLIDQYACSNELSLYGVLAGMGTICHEFSHCLGLPDLYNTLTGATVLDAFDLMDAGNYNGNGWCPIGYSSYERMACGWLTPQPTNDPQATETIEPLYKTPDARIFRVTPDDNDFYLIENRVDATWDHFMPFFGIFAWYVDYDAEAWRENLVNTNPSHYRVNRVRLNTIPAALSAPVADKAIVGYYDLHGRRLAGVPDMPGVYVLRYTDGTTKKVFR
ncbi:MAG: M6 family metalloprotease domain-containing protein [Prevotella sp.]|nr:M6 family metalloprotease domain-containing protein [Prevotella sp.]